MNLGIVGRKRGMTRIFIESGTSIPVTVIEVVPNRVTRVMSEGPDGVRALQIAWGSKPHRRLRKSDSGLYIKVGIEPAEGVFECRMTTGEGMNLEPGSELGVGIFSPEQKVDVTGTTRGKGFAGVIKRHHFSAQRATHGNSLSHRAPGSIGQCQFPGKVFKGKKMAGHMGNKRRTVQNLEVVRVDVERNLLLVKGAVPGSVGDRLMVRHAVKSVAH